jgi:DNA-binding transcriptional LysR family regulator
LRVLASPGASLDVVPSALSRLVRQFPSARVYMETVPVRDMTGLLARNEADVAISTLPVAHAALASERIGRWSLACVFPKGHKLERKSRVALRDLEGERLVAFGADTPQGKMLESSQVRSQIEVRSGQVACSLVAKGAGVAIVDNLTASAWPDGRIAFRPLSGSPSFEMFAVSNAGVPRSQLLDAFVRSTAEELRARARAQVTPAAPPQPAVVREPAGRRARSPQR